MKNELKKVIKTLEGWEFEELTNAMRIAKNVRQIKRSYDLENSDIAEILGIPEKKVVQLMDGTHEYDLMTLAKLEVMDADLNKQRYLEKNKMVEVASLKGKEND